ARFARMLRVDWRRFVVTIVFGAGCFNPHYEQTSCPAGQCPMGLTCIDGQCRQCLGGAFLTVCLQSAPMGQMSLSSSVDTGGSMCVAIEVAISTSGADKYCVLAGTRISIIAGANVRATGSKPLVLVASDSISVDGTLDVGSHRGLVQGGAGFNFAGCEPGVTP